MQNSKEITHLQLEPQIKHFNCQVNFILRLKTYTFSSHSTYSEIITSLIDKYNTSIIDSYVCEIFVESISPNLLSGEIIIAITATFIAHSAKHFLFIISHLHTFNVKFCYLTFTHKETEDWEFCDLPIAMQCLNGGTRN